MSVLVVGNGSHHCSSVCRLPNVSANSVHVETGERLETMLGLGSGLPRRIRGQCGWLPKS